MSNGLASDKGDNASGSSEYRGVESEDIGGIERNAGRPRSSVEEWAICEESRERREVCRRIDFSGMLQYSEKEYSTKRKS